MAAFLILYENSERDGQVACTARDIHVPSNRLWNPSQ